MTVLDNGLDAAGREMIASVLKSRCTWVEATSAHSWRSRAPGGATIVVSVRNGWVHLESPLVTGGGCKLPGARRSQWLLTENSMLAGGVSYAVAPRCRRPFLTADYGWHEQDSDSLQWADDFERLVERFCAVREEPCRQPIRDSRSPETPLPQPQPLSVDDEMGDLARQLCTATGWEYHERGNGQLAITLDLDSQFSQAYVYSTGLDRLRLATSLEVPSAGAARTRQAMALFLLTATYVVRLARAAIVPTPAGREYRWEVGWPRGPSAEQFHSGLSALSIACRMSWRELQALSDASIADSYLMLRGRSSQ